MKEIATIWRRELGAFFNTPIGYVVLVFFLILSCWFHAWSLFAANLAEMRTFFGVLPFLFLIIAPAIAMRLWAEERKLGTLELLMTFPLKTWHAVVGKFLASLSFLAIGLLLTIHLPIILYYLSPEGSPGPDIGPILGGYLGALFLGMIYLSICSFASSLTSDQIIAYIIGFSIGCLFFLISSPQFLGWVRDFNPNYASVLERFGINYHFESIARGVVDTRDVVYALSTCSFFLFLNVLVIQRRR